MSDTLTNPENITTSAGRDDAITATASQRPWRVADGWHEAIVDEHNNVVASGSNSANAALIVEAVNGWTESARKLVKSEADLYNETKMRVAAESERDRLRDIVRRLCDELESHYYEPQSMDDPSIVREARAAIGEDKP